MLTKINFKYSILGTHDLNGRSDIASQQIHHHWSVILWVVLRSDSYREERSHKIKCVYVVVTRQLKLVRTKKQKNNTISHFHMESHSFLSKSSTGWYSSLNIRAYTHIYSCPLMAPPSHTPTPKVLARRSDGKLRKYIFNNTSGKLRLKGIKCTHRWRRLVIWINLSFLFMSIKALQIMKNTWVNTWLKKFPTEVKEAW